MGTLTQVAPSLQRQLDEILDNYPAWPRREFNLSMESRQLYQDTTSKAIDNYSDISRVTVDEKVFYCYNDTSKDTIRGSEPYEKKFRIDEFLSRSGNMANLATYVAICKVYNELEVDTMEVRPEDEFRTTLYHTGRVPDAYIGFPNEHVPVEVYNGGDFVNDRNDKHDQLMDLKSTDDQDIECNPMFVNRRSTMDYKQQMLDQNTVIIDTDLLFSSESLYANYQDAIEFFDLDPIVEALPKLEATNGDLIDGDDYDIKDNGDQGYSTSERNDALLPPTGMATDSDKLPDEFLKRVRGGIQLHYVYTLYRRTSDSVRGAACLVVQNVYNNLLRADTGVPRDEAISQGWDDATDQYGWIKQIDEQKIRKEMTDIVQHLCDVHVLRKYDGSLTTRGATHPQQSFSMS